MKKKSPFDRLKDKVSLMAAAAFLKAGRAVKGEEKSGSPGAADPPGTIYSFTMKTIDGRDKPLSDYEGKVLLIVNTASRCGLTPQYDGLEELYRRYKDRGLSLLAFPANEFGSQEPGSDSQIQEFCRTNFGVSFDLFSKIVVKGPGQHPLYDYLTHRSGRHGEITWNFEKFLVSRDGRVDARFTPEIDPLAEPLVKALESLL